MKTKKIDTPLCEAMTRYQMVTIKACLDPRKEYIDLVVECDASEAFVVFSVVQALRALEVDPSIIATADLMIR